MKYVRCRFVWGNKLSPSFTWHCLGSECCLNPTCIWRTDLCTYYFYLIILSIMYSLHFRIPIVSYLIVVITFCSSCIHIFDCISYLLLTDDTRLGTNYEPFTTDWPVIQTHSQIWTKICRTTRNIMYLFTRFRKNGCGVKLGVVTSRSRRYVIIFNSTVFYINSF